MFISALKTILAVVLSMLNVLALPFVGHMNDYFQPKNPDTVRLNFAVISDTHVQDSAYRQAKLELGLEDMDRAYGRLDALVINGDMTDHGYREQYERIAKAFEGHDPAENILFVEGNHDSWTRDVVAEGDFQATKDIFIEYNSKIAGNEIDDVYYSTRINGYPFIVIGSEYDHTDAYISDTQLEWLENEMEEASKLGLPIFVFSHWPLKNTHGLPGTWGDSSDPLEGCLGQQADAVEAIVKKYDNVFYISGHVHSGFSSGDDAAFTGYASVESEGSFHSVNLPSYMYMSPMRGTSHAFGTGYQFEVYEDQVLLRARNYMTGFWLPKYDVTIPLV